MSFIRNMYNRVYSDYFLKERIEIFKDLIENALESGFIFTSVIEYYESIIHKQPKKKAIIFRHDIDTDIKTAKRFFEIEKAYSIHASYYFRLSTLAPNFMNEINEFGSEASYHYEEISTYCKHNKIKDVRQIIASLPDIRLRFINNFFDIQQKISVPMKSVASHGDFVNRYLKFYNYQLLDADVRLKCGIEVEAYDPIIKSNCISISDDSYPSFWKPIAPQEALKKDNNIIINILTHPRHWCTSWSDNTKDNLQRLLEGFKYFTF